MFSQQSEPLNREDKNCSSPSQTGNSAIHQVRFTKPRILSKNYQPFWLLHAEMRVTISTRVVLMVSLNPTLDHSKALQDNYYLSVQYEWSSVFHAFSWITFITENNVMGQTMNCGRRYKIQHRTKRNEQMRSLLRVIHYNRSQSTSLPEFKRMEIEYTWSLSLYVHVKYSA